jgi:pimeloyl-ACP methyl ester carboxylesterase
MMPARTGTSALSTLRPNCGKNLPGRSASDGGKRRVQRQRSTIKAAGRLLAVERLRPRQHAGGPPLVFLHEGLGCIAMWKDFPARLCERLGLEGIVYDRWGHGLAEPLDRPRTVRYLHDEAQIFLPALLRELGIGRAILVGHSDGGTIALLFAAAFPALTAAVVAEAAHVFVEEITLAGIRAAVEAYATTNLPQRLARYHGAKTESIFRAWHECWLSPAFRDWNIEAELARIVCPTLVLQGEADEYGTPAQVTAIAKGVTGPAETALLPGCAHIPHLQAAEAVLDRIAGFLERHVLRESRP